MDRLEPFHDAWSDLTGQIIASAIAVHSELGPGFLEAIYRKALVLDLHAKGLHASAEVEVPIHYLGMFLGRHRLDLVVAARAVVELKAVAKLDAVHFAQVRSYLAASNLPVGLLVNFGGARVECRRIYPSTERGIHLASRASRVPAPDHAGLSAGPQPATSRPDRMP